MATTTLRIFGLLACALLAASAVGCGDDDDDGGDETPAASPTAASAGTPSDGEATVEVQLAEFSMIPSPSTVSAGAVTFVVTNDGPEDVHEFVIVRTDLDDSELPRTDEGGVAEDDLEVVDEIEDIPVGETQELTVDLASGAYVLLCNIVEEEDGVTESHYENGMHRAFTVE